MQEDQLAQPRALGRYSSQRRDVRAEPLSPLPSLRTYVLSSWRFPCFPDVFPRLPGISGPLLKPCHVLPSPTWFSVASVNLPPCQRVLEWARSLGS